MRWLDRRGMVQVILFVVGVVALVGGLDSRSSWAADPDRYVFESDRESDRFDEAELEALLEQALGGLESLDHLEALDDLAIDIEDFADGLAEQFGQALERGAMRIDRDWPDTIRLRTGRHDVGFDTVRLSRQVERMARRIERNVVRGLERESTRCARRVRVWRDRDQPMDREDIETGLREQIGRAHV